jgi:hypothetical protein
MKPVSVYKYAAHRCTSLHFPLSPSSLTTLSLSYIPRPSFFFHPKPPVHHTVTVPKNGQWMQSHPAGHLPPGGRLGPALRRRLKRHAGEDDLPGDEEHGEALRRLHTASEDAPTFGPVGEAQLHRPGEGGAHAQASLMICGLITGSP